MPGGIRLKVKRRANWETPRGPLELPWSYSGTPLASVTVGRTQLRYSRRGSGVLGSVWSTEAVTTSTVTWSLGLGGGAGWQLTFSTMPLDAFTTTSVAFIKWGTVIVSE